MFVSTRLFPVLLALSLVAGACSQPKATPEKTEPVQKELVSVKLVSFNDFHGNLEGPAGTVTVDGEKVEAGGVAHMKAYVDAFENEEPNTMVVAAGDLVGASPLVSAVFHDEPTIEAMNELGLKLSAVGNHEFDQGWQELLRLQRGGCHPDDGCLASDPFEGAKFKFLSANVVVDETGAMLFPAYTLESFDDIPVAFIGLTLEDAPSIISPEAVEGLTFRDEATSINEIVPAIQQEGAETIIVLIHEGGRHSKEVGSVNDCGDLDGPIVDIVKATSDEVDVFVTGHSHQTYICEIDGKLVTSAKSYGRILTEIDLKIDPETKDVVSKSAVNQVVYTDKLEADAKMSALVQSYVDKSAEVAKRAVGSISASISREPNQAGESALGDVIADAQLAATSAPDKGGAQIALMNPGGIRANLEATAEDKQVTYEDLHRVQPFGNNLMTMTLTGEQLHDLLEMQWTGSHPKILQVSKGFSYAWNKNGAPGDRVDIASMKLDGESIDPKTDYRVTVNSFLASGGDGFTLLKDGTERRAGSIDLDVLVSYFEQNSPIGPGPQDRIEMVESRE